MSQRTEVRIVYDDAALYIGAWLFDEDPAGIEGVGGGPGGGRQQRGSAGGFNLNRDGSWEVATTRDDLPRRGAP